MDPINIPPMNVSIHMPAPAGSVRYGPGPKTSFHPALKWALPSDRQAESTIRTFSSALRCRVASLVKVFLCDIFEIWIWVKNCGTQKIINFSYVNPRLVNPGSMNLGDDHVCNSNSISWGTSTTFFKIYFSSLLNAEYGFRDPRHVTQNN